MFRLLRLALLSVFLMGLTAPAEAQTLSLDTATFFADSALVHTALPVRWTGRISWSTTTNTSYSLVYSFGDGSSYTVTKAITAGSNPYGEDTFRAVHAYASPGTYIAKVVVKNAAGAAVDSLVRPGTAGSGYAVAGRFYYDCTRNCAIDTGELWLGKVWMRHRVNRKYRYYLTDSLGYFTASVPLGDTFYRATLALDFTTTYVGCALPAITSTNRAAHVGLWLWDDARMYNFQANSRACTNMLYQSTVLAGDQAATGNTCMLRWRSGDGAVSSYTYSTDPYFSWAHIYPNPGTYTFTVEMFGMNFSGPYMRFQQVVHVDTCKPIQLRPYFDVNKNCVADTTAGESSTGNSYMMLRSKLLGTQSVGVPAGMPAVFNYKLYPGDTVLADTLLYVNLGTNPFPTANSDTASLRRNCPGTVLTDASPSMVRIPYNAHATFSEVPPTQPYFMGCYSDTVHLKLKARFIGFAPGVATAFKLISLWDDGTVDSSTFTTSLDTTTFFVKHVYAAPGVKECRFLLRAPNGDVDTLAYPIWLDSCYFIQTHVFLDTNRNCIRDAGEPLLTSYDVTTGTGTTLSSDPATGKLYFSLYAGSTADSITSVSLPSATTPSGRFNRVLNAAAGCPWPIVDFGAPAQQFLPLVDTPQLLYTYNRPQPGPCDSMSAPTINLGLNPAGNYSLPYTVVHSAGDGLQADTFTVAGTATATFTLPQRKFAAGTYQPVLRIRHGSTIIRTLYPASFTITDTCTAARGYLYADADASCTPSAPDVPLGGQPVRLAPGSSGTSQIALTNAAGRFYAKLPAGTSYSVVRPSLIGGSLQPACGTSAVSALTFNVSGAYPYACVAGTDLSLLASHHYFQPGTADTLLLYPGGTACNGGSGTLALTLPADLTYTGSNLPGLPAVSGGTHTWTLDTLRKVPSVIRIGLAVAPAPVASDLCLSARLAGPGTDPTPADNDFYLCDSVRAAVPALYKSQSSDSMTAAGVLVPNKELVYSLRVRNQTGAAISNLILYDTLSAKLDLGTLHLLDASFPATLSLLPGRVLRISNSGTIALPHGGEAAVRFGIRHTSGLTGAQLVLNRAAVVLNGLPAGTTNTTLATVTLPQTPGGGGNGGGGNGGGSGGTAVADLNASDGPVVYPVPLPEGATAYLRLPAPVPARYEITDLAGRPCGSGACTGLLTRLDAPAVPGVYLVRVHTDAAVYTCKLIVAGR